MAEELKHHHVSPNGLHPLHIIGPARVDQHNSGDVVGYDEETTEKLLAMKQPDGNGPVVERAVRVLMKKDAKHWLPAHNPPLKAGTLPALPPGFAKQLVADGAAEYATKAHDEAELARQKHADGEHYRKLAESMAAMQPAPVAPAPAKRA